MKIFNLNQLSECIIVASKFKDNDIYLLKNRDRSYSPNIKIIHEIKDDVEICYIYDEITGWSEGLNEFGIGVVNTALMVGRDEKEKKIVKKTGEKSKDGKKIRKALTKKSVEDVIKVITNDGDNSGGVKGHTFVVSKDGKGFHVELTSKHDVESKELNLDKVTVRTNHGYFYPNAGYDDGEDYKSSIYRKNQAEAIDTKLDMVSALNYLKTKNYSHSSHLNMNRDTDNMFTTGQVGINITKLTLYYDCLNGKSNFIEIDNKLPEDYESKIKIVVYKDPEDIVKNNKKEK